MVSESPLYWRSWRTLPTGWTPRLPRRGASLPLARRCRYLVALPARQPRSLSCDATSPTVEAAGAVDAKNASTSSLDNAKNAFPTATTVLLKCLPLRRGMRRQGYKVSRGAGRLGRRGRMLRDAYWERCSYRSNTSRSEISRAPIQPVEPLRACRAAGGPPPRLRRYGEVTPRRASRAKAEARYLLSRLAEVASLALSRC